MNDPLNPACKNGEVFIGGVGGVGPGGLPLSRLSFSLLIAGSCSSKSKRNPPTRTICTTTILFRRLHDFQQTGCGLGFLSLYS